MGMCKRCKKVFSVLEMEDGFCNQCINRPIKDKKESTIDDKVDIKKKDKKNAAVFIFMYIRIILLASLSVMLISSITQIPFFGAKPPKPYGDFLLFLLITLILLYFAPRIITFIMKKKYLKIGIPTGIGIFILYGIIMIIYNDG